MENGINGFNDVMCPTSTNHVLEHVVHNLRNNVPLWEDVLLKGQKLQNNLRQTLQTSTAFMDSVQKVADAMTHSPSGLKDVGCNLTRFCVRQRAVEEKTKLFNYHLAESLINPLQDRLEDWRRINGQFEREKQRDWKRARLELKKAIEDVERISKKTKRKNSVTIGPEAQLQLEFAQQDVTEKHHLCREMERQALEKALVEEKRRYIDFLACLRPLWEHQMGLLQEMERLQESLQALDHYSSDPNDLPPETRQLIEFYEVPIPSTLSKQQQQHITTSRGATESQYLSASGIGYATLQSKRLSRAGSGSFATINSSSSGADPMNFGFQQSQANGNTLLGSSRVWSVSSGSRSSIASSETSSIFSNNTAPVGSGPTQNIRKSREQKYLSSPLSPIQNSAFTKSGVAEELAKLRKVSKPNEDNDEEGGESESLCESSCSNGSEDIEDSEEDSQQSQNDSQTSKPNSSQQDVPEPALPVRRPSGAAFLSPRSFSPDSPTPMETFKSNLPISHSSNKCSSFLPSEFPSSDAVRSGFHQHHYANTNEIQQRLASRLQAATDNYTVPNSIRHATPPRACQEDIDNDVNSTNTTTQSKDDLSEDILAPPEQFSNNSSSVGTNGSKEEHKSGRAMTPSSKTQASEHHSITTGSNKTTFHSELQSAIRKGTSPSGNTNLPSAVVRGGVPVLPGHALLRSVSHQQQNHSSRVDTSSSPTASLLSPALLRRMSVRDTVAQMDTSKMNSTIQQHQHQTSQQSHQHQVPRKVKPPVSRRSSSLCRGEEIRSQLEEFPISNSDSNRENAASSVAHEASVLVSQSRLLSSSTLEGSSSFRSSKAPQRKPSLPPKPRFSIDNAMATLKRGAAGVRSLVTQDIFGNPHTGSKDGNNLNLDPDESLPYSDSRHYLSTRTSDISYMENGEWQGVVSSASPCDEQLHASRTFTYAEPDQLRQTSFGTFDYTPYSFLGTMSPTAQTPNPYQPPVTQNLLGTDSSHRNIQRTFFT